MEAFDACARRGVPFDLELQLVAAKGREVWIRALGEAERDAQGSVTHVRGAIQDVSRFRAVADEARLTAERFFSAHGITLSQAHFSQAVKHLRLTGSDPLRPLQTG